MATSREPLGISGEVVYRVSSLTVPPPETEAADLSFYEAAMLFLERARAARPGFAAGPATAEAIATICIRLDGIPLAIELAAARVNVLPVEALAARLDDCFRLLTGGPRTVLPRQRTLRATLDWSYALLEAPERALLRRLAVFAGGLALDGVEAVCVRELTEQFERAATLCRESMELSVRAGDQRSLLIYIVSMARALTCLGRHDRAAVLCGAVDEGLKKLHISSNSPEWDGLRRLIQAVRRELVDEAYAAAYARGQLMNKEQYAAFGLEL